MLCKEKQKQTHHSRHEELCPTEVTLCDGGNFPLTEYQHTNELLKPTELQAFVIRKHEGAFFNFLMNSKFKKFDPC